MQKNLIYDVGLFNGDDTAYYLAAGFRVIAIEANPDMVDRTTQRFRQEVTSGSLIILNVGVSDQEGTLPFYVTDSYPEWNTFNKSVADEKNVTFREFMIPCRPFRSILEEFGTPFYLKLDIEGNEIYCLRDLVKSDLPEYVSFEKTEKFTWESLCLLRDLGYKRFKLISQRQLLPVEYPPSLEQTRYEKWQNLMTSRNIPLRVIRRAGARRWVNPTRYRPDWNFPFGSSGPFGADTPGKWQTFDEITETLAKADSAFAAKSPSIFWNQESYSFWADIHAKRSN